MINQPQMTQLVGAVFALVTIFVAYNYVSNKFWSRTLITIGGIELVADLIFFFNGGMTI